MAHRLIATDLGRDASDLIGSVLLHRAWQAAQRLGPLAHSTRPPFLCLVDECHRFCHLPQGMATALAQARGYGVGMVLAHQNLAQLKDHELTEAVDANCQTKLCFGLGAADAKRMAVHFEPRLDAHDLLHLGAHTIACRVLHESHQLPAATATTEPPSPPTPGDTTGAIRDRARAQATERSAVETAIRERYGHIEQPPPGRAAADETQDDNGRELPDLETKGAPFGAPHDAPYHGAPPPPAIPHQHSDPLLTSELGLLFFSGLRNCNRRLLKLEGQDLLLRVYPARSHRGGRSEALWFLSPTGRQTIGAPGRRPPSLSIPDLEHRRAVARFFLGLIERNLTSGGEGLYSWLGELQAQEGTGASVRPDGYGRYLLPYGEITFYLEIDRATEPARRVKAKLDAYKHALAADPNRERGNILLVCDGPRRLANLARCAPPGPPWIWGSTDGECYELLPARDQERHFDELPASPRKASRHLEDCLGRRWRQLSSFATTGGRAI